VAFDGDADRAIFVAASGKTVNGDAVLLAAARALKAAGRLPGDTVVATVMSNLGLEKALERAGIRMTRTPVATNTCWKKWSGWERRWAESSPAT